MDPAALPSADERARVTVLVRPLGARQTTLFNRVLERLTRQRALLVSDNPRRVLQANFVSTLNPEFLKFGELQTHRRVFAVVGVACSAAASTSVDGWRKSSVESAGTSSSTSSSTMTSSGIASMTTTPSSVQSRRLPSLTGDAAVAQLEEIHAQYKTLKAEHANTVVDSRCVLIGFDEDATRKVFSSRETLSFPALDESAELEHGIRELLRAVYTVVESRRVDGNLTSGKAIDSNIACPLLPEEERFRVGVENRDSKTYRRKVAGRFKKQVADLALLGGLPKEAMEAYSSAIEQLKTANDLLWLAGAYEGWAVAAMALRFSDPVAALLDVPAENGLHRVSSMTPEQMRQVSGELRGGGGGTENGVVMSEGGTNHVDHNHLSATITPSVAMNNNSTTPSSQYLGHHRYRSDEGGKLPLTSLTSAPPEGSSSASSMSSTLKRSKLPWATLRRDRRGDCDTEEIVEKIELALENYAKFSFAVLIEYECMMVAVEAYRRDRQYISMEQLHREKVGKYLDDSFTKFDHPTKATICSHAALLYKKIGFRRKHAFFSRLGVLFRLHMDEASQRTPNDYRSVYPTLYRTLAGYGIPERAEPSVGLFCSETVANGPVMLQIKALHEVFTSAMRAHFYEAAIRHCCYLLQVYYDHMDAAMVGRLFVDLETLVRQRSASTPSPSSSSASLPSSASGASSSASAPALHHLGQHLSLECGIIIPPVQMTRFPMISEPTVCPLPAHLAPRVIPATADGPSIFIYSPFQTRNDDDGASLCWVVDCACSLSVLVYNCRPTELAVHELVLISEGGVAFEPVPVRMTLPPANEGAAPARIKLIGVPRAPGRLTLSGYSCIVFGVRNVCRLQSASGRPLSVQVLPALPSLSFDTTLPRAPIMETEEGAGEEMVAELKVYSGQTFEHVLTVRNASECMGIENVRLSVHQPKVTGGPSLIEVLSMNDGMEENGERPGDEHDVDEHGGDDDVKEGVIRLRRSTTTERSVEDDSFGLRPLEERRIRMKIFGIDPTGTTDDGGGSADDRARQSTATLDWASQTPSCSSSIAAPGASTAATTPVDDQNGGQHDLIPYTGRLLVAEFVFTYEADLRGPEGERYSRRGRFRLLISIVPALSVSSWSVLPGDGPFSRYIVVDVSNASDSDAELVYSGTKAISVQPKETCRVPLLSACCLEVGGRAFHTASQCDSHHMQRQEIERLRRRLEAHVASHLDIRWSIPSYQLEGLVPVGALLSSVALLKQLVLPAISLTVYVNDSSSQTEYEVSVGIGELVSLRVDVVSSLDYALTGSLIVVCHQEISSSHSPLERSGAIVCTGAKKIPFTLMATPPRSSSISSSSSSIPPSPCFSAHFHFFFRTEGQFKLRPMVLQDQLPPSDNGRIPAPLQDDEIFVTPITFNASTKGVR